MKKYKIKDTYILKQVMDEYIVVPFGGETVDFNSMITLNESGAFIWECMQSATTEDDVISKLCSEYDVSFDAAACDVKEFISKLADAGVLENE